MDITLEDDSGNEHTFDVPDDAKVSASARMAGYKADDVPDAVRYECEEFSAQHEKWKRGEGRYPSTDGIVKALADAGII